MTEIQVKRLVNEAVLLHRDIAIRTERLKTLKAELVREARRHEHEFTATDNGGSRWSVTGNNGCIARVNFPAPALTPLIESESETFDHVSVSQASRWIVFSRPFISCAPLPISATKSARRYR